MVYKTNLLYHLKAVNESLPHFRVEAQLNVQDLRLTVRGRNRYYVLTPQFVTRNDGRVSYSPFFDKQVVGFIGWLPYFNRRWPTGSDKFSFKEFCEAQGLRTPRYWRKLVDPIGDCLIKRTNSSFAIGFRGPFRTIDARDPAHRLAEGEYYERFVEGRIAKAWYWEDKLVSLEMRDMPTVSGNGKATLYELVQAATVPPQQPPERRDIEGLVQYQGFSLDEVVPPGKTVIADFRYTSGLFRLNHENSGVLHKYADTAAGRQLAEAGATFRAGIPAELRSGTLYTVDAIVDAADDVWFLEMNCNPMVHPDCYLPMLEGLFGAAEKVAVPAHAIGLSYGAPAGPHMPPSGSRPPHPSGHPNAPASMFAQGPLMPGDLMPGMRPAGMPPPGGPTAFPAPSEKI
jgi:hypothetical protein